LKVKRTLSRIYYFIIYYHSEQHNTKMIKQKNYRGIYAKYFVKENGRFRIKVL